MSCIISVSDILPSPSSRRNQDFSLGDQISENSPVNSVSLLHFKQPAILVIRGHRICAKWIYTYWSGILKSCAAEMFFIF